MRMVRLIVTALPLALTNCPLRADEAEDKAVLVVEAAHGKVIRDEKKATKPVIEIWLGQKVTDQQLQLLVVFKDLQTLELVGCTELTDAGLKQLDSLPQLRNLDLTGTHLTPAVLKGHPFIKRIEGVSFSCTKVTDAELKDLAGFESLRWLSLSFTDLNGVELKNLSGLKHLRYLDVSHCKGVTDEALKKLATFKELEELDLSGCMITDKAVPGLASCKRLRSLHLFPTAVTDAGAAKLRKALPKCEIEHADLESLPVPGDPYRSPKR